MTVPAGSGGGNRWFDVWADRRLDPSRGSLLAQLLAAGGFDTSSGSIDDANWIAYVRHWAEALEITPQTSVFEVGCGAGAFLYELQRLGCPVGGIDRSEALVEIARAAIPEGSFEVADAAELPVEPAAEVVVSSSVFHYFPSVDYARLVLERMAAKASRAVLLLLLDLPDSTRRKEAIAHRVISMGGAEAYAERRAGLDHLYYGREWIEEAMRACGLHHVCSADQRLAGYENARFRFNAWGLV